MSFPRYPKYKASGVEWLGEVPEGWEVKRLKHNVRLLTEKTDRRDHPVALENVEGWSGRLIPTETAFEGEGIAFESGDILFGKLRPYLAKAYLAKSAGEAVGDFHVLRPATGVDGRFTQYQILNREFISIVDGSTFGAKMPRASWDFVGGMKVTLPPLSEQTAIAEFLDRETGKIDELVAEQRRLIELLKEKRQAVISHAVTKGLNPHAPMKPSGIEWLGNVPEHWDRTRIKRAARSGNKTFVDGDWIETPYITTEGVRLLQCGNVGTGVFEEQGFRYISEQTFASFDCTEVEPGNVLICRLQSSRTILAGRACLAPDLGVKMITSVDNCIVKPSKEFDPRYIVYQLSTNEYLSFVEVVARGGTRDRVSRSMLGNIDLVAPPVKEQKQIADFLDTELAKFDTLTAESQRAIDLLQERRTALISAAVTGQIDVRPQTLN